MKPSTIELVARRFRLLGDPCRLRLLQALAGGEQSVNQLAAALGLTQPNVSRHLQALHAAGLVGRRPAGNSVYYSVADPTVFKLCELVCDRATEQARTQLAGLLRRRRQ